MNPAPVDATPVLMPLWQVQDLVEVLDSALQLAVAEYADPMLIRGLHHHVGLNRLRVATSRALEEKEKKMETEYLR
jgi:hypothetical protein